MGYTRDAVKGASWIGLLRISSKLIGFLEILILARILDPDQFGVYAIALLTLGFLETITETGVNVFLIQEKEIDRYISSAWIVSVSRGIFIALVLYIASPFIAAFFNSQSSLNLLYLICFVPILRGFINPSIVKFQKNLEFNKNFIYQFIVLMIDTVISIVATYVTKSPIGIVVGLISGVIIELSMSFIFVKPVPDFSIKISYLKLIFNRGKWITANGVFDYFFHNLDNVVVGKLLGAASLGVYQLAYSIAVMPIEEIGKVFVHVSTPILARISGEKDRRNSAYIKLLLTSFMLCLLFASFIFLIPQVLILIIGSKWSEIAVILPALAFLGFIKGVSGTSSSIFLSLKKQQYLTISTFINILVLGILIVPLTKELGLYGASLSALIGAIAAVPFMIVFVVKVLRSY